MTRRRAADIPVKGLSLAFRRGRYALGGFASTALPRGWAFTRATARTALTGAGALVSFASGEPAITDAGLSMEEARTNLLLNSAVLVSQTVTVAAVPYVLSFYGTGTVTLSGVSVAGPLVGTGAGNRVSLAFTPLAGALILTVTGSVTTAQLEAGAFATSPIITGGAAVTRNKDDASITALSLLTPPFTLYGRAVLNAVDNVSQRIVQLDDGTGTNRIFVNRLNPATLIIQATAGGVLQTEAVSVSKPGARTVQFALLVEPGSYRAAVDGVLSAAVAVTLPSNLSRLLLGINDSGASLLNGVIEDVLILPYAVPAAQMQAMTQ
jgi:hypothetical protein